MKVLISNKEDLINVCSRFNLKLYEIRRLFESAVKKGIMFDSSFVMSEMTRGQGGMRSFYDIPNKEILELRSKMMSRIIEQDLAVEMVCKAIMRAKAFAISGGRPPGCFFFAGPTGTGKSQTAKSLAHFLYKNELALIYIDMSGYKHPGDISRLIGASPGYVGYDEEGGILTRMVKKIKCGIILFDEFEKADPEVLDILLRISDEGKYTDASTGETVTLSEFIIIATSNLGSEKVLNKSDPEKVREIIMRAVERHLRPELLNRFDDVIVYQSLSRKACCRIAEILLKEALERVRTRCGIRVDYTDRLIEEIVVKGYNPRYNARPIARTIDRLVITPLADNVLNEKLSSNEHLQLDWVEGKLKAIRINPGS